MVTMGRLSCHDSVERDECEFVKSDEVCILCGVSGFSFVFILFYLWWGGVLGMGMKEEGGGG